MHNEKRMSWPAPSEDWARAPHEHRPLVACPLNRPFAFPNQSEGEAWWCPKGFSNSMATFPPICWLRRELRYRTSQCRHKATHHLLIVISTDARILAFINSGTAWMIPSGLLARCSSSNTCRESRRSDSSSSENCAMRCVRST